MVLLLMFSALAAAGIAGSVVIAVRDGYRRLPSRTPRTLEP
jgi:hypothetical protein